MSPATDRVRPAGRWSRTCALAPLAAIMVLAGARGDGFASAFRRVVGRLVHRPHAGGAATFRWVVHEHAKPAVKPGDLLHL